MLYCLGDFIGDYVIEEAIGGGAQGHVYRAHHKTNLADIVAIKVLKEGASEVDRNRFFIEQHCLARLGRVEPHSNIVQLRIAAQPDLASMGMWQRIRRWFVSWTTVVQPDLAYTVTAFIPGGNLREYLAKYGPLYPKEAIRVMIPIASAVHHIHQVTQGIHRDIKPENILLRNRLVPVLTDFGIWRPFHKSAAASPPAVETVLGAPPHTPGYLPPELKGNPDDPITPCCDVYNLGVVLVELLTGKKPYPVSISESYFIPSSTPSLDELRWIPPDLGTICRRCLESDPQKRYQTAQELVIALQEVQAASTTPSSETLPPDPPLVFLHAVPDSEEHRTVTPICQRATRLTSWGKVSMIAAVGIIAMTLAIGISVRLGHPNNHHAPELPAPLSRPAEALNANTNTIQQPALSEPPPPTDRISTYSSLFNGRDLTGWKTHPAQTGEWKVEDGMLTGTASGGSYLYSEKTDFQNFHLIAEARLSAGGNAGIFFRCGFGPDARQPNVIMAPDGYEADLFFPPSEPSQCGALIAKHGEPPAFPAECGAVPDEWLRYEVWAVGNRMITYVNGHKAAEFTDRTGRKEKGHIALQVFNSRTKFEIRKLQFRELASTESVNDTANRFGKLFNGRNLTGWRIAGPRKTEFSVNDGVLEACNTGDQGYVNHLISARTDYTDCRLQCQFQLVDPTIPAIVQLRIDPSDVGFGGMRGYVVEVRGSTRPGDDRDTGETVLTLGSRCRPNCKLDSAPHRTLAAGEWHQLEVLITGNRIRINVNTQLIIDYTDEGRAFLRGAIGLQFRPGNRIKYRGIELANAEKETGLQPKTNTDKTDKVRNRWASQGLVGNKYNERWLVFQKASGKEWIQSITHYPNGFQRYNFIEIDQTEDYIELNRTDNNSIVRLYNSYAESISSSLKPVRLYEGEWEK